MRLISNTATERVVDILSDDSNKAQALDALSPVFSVFALQKLIKAAPHLKSARLVVSAAAADASQILGADDERGERGTLTAPHAARLAAEWFAKLAEIRPSPVPIHQNLISTRDADGQPIATLTGHCPLNLTGLGLLPPAPFSLVQAADQLSEHQTYANWFLSSWNQLPADQKTSDAILASLREIARDHSAAEIYAKCLDAIFGGEEISQSKNRLMRAGAGFQESAVWRKLYRFQRDAVAGSLEKLEKFGGCIIADSVGLGKTFEALAVIKYYEIQNDRVLVLCPKRLRDNWVLYTSNSDRNVLAEDNFRYKVLHHTDLSRETGTVGDIDLKDFNWNNYDLVVIDESHNFRNKKSPRQGGLTRYDHLMQKIILDGGKTRVLMLSATPVNNRLTDLRNQIAFITENDDKALEEHGIKSIDATVRKAQSGFNEWQKLPAVERHTASLVRMLGFDYFKLLDSYTLARSRKHIEKYYGTEETGVFPERLKPINHRVAIDTADEFPPIKEINNEIRKLHLAAYAPLNYVLPSRKAYYDEKYSTKLQGNKGTFRQSDREQSLIHLMRVNLLKRMESSVESFRLTIERQRTNVEAMLDKINAKAGLIGELLTKEFEEDDPLFESIVTSRRIEVNLEDLDLVRWNQDLTEDANRLNFLYAQAEAIESPRDRKLATLREMIAEKVRNPLNPGNTKIIVFTTFADTARYLYKHLAPWCRENSLNAAMITGSGGYQTTLDTVAKDQVSLLSAFAPRAKERPEKYAHEGEIDLLIATDCISEGQNLQDCDFLINYDIHWNPVRIIQRFGRIDRLGSPNTVIQLVNFWPDLELNEYIDLEERVSGRMVLLDVSATGEENVIETQSGDPMNDLEYRRAQLIKLQESVVDLEDVSGGVSITDLTLTDFRLDLARFREEITGSPAIPPLGAFAAITGGDAELPPGTVFCLRAESPAVLASIDPSYPLRPHFLIHVSDDGALLLSPAQARLCLDLLKTAANRHPEVDEAAIARQAKATRHGENMDHPQELLAKAISAITGIVEERKAASLFDVDADRTPPGGTPGVGDFEVIAYLVIHPAA